MADVRSPEDQPRPGPRDRPLDEPTAGWIGDAKDVFTVGKDVVNIVRGVHGPTGETFETAVFRCERDTTTKDRLVLVVNAHNASRHGVYVERVSIGRHQTREGQELGEATYEVRTLLSANRSIGTHLELLNTPILIAPDERRSFTVYIDLTRGTWPTVDAYGVVVFRVTKLEAVAPADRTQTFPIRRYE